MFGILARAMIGVTASDSPELVGPQIAWTLSGRDHLLRGVHGLGRIALGVAGDDLDLAALDAAGGVDGLGREQDAAVEADGRGGARAGQGGEPADPDRLALGD